MNTKSPSLGKLGDHILELFHSITNARSNLSQECDSQLAVSDAEVEAQRFRLWATNLNLFHEAHGSLDYRLRDAPDIHKLAQQLLEELSESLVADIVSGKRLPYEKALEDPYPQSPIQPDVASLPPFEADSSSSGSSTASDEESDEPPSGEAQVRWADATSIVQKLYKFSTDIRNSSTKSGPGDRPPFPKEPIEKQLEFIDELASIESRLVKSHLQKSLPPEMIERLNSTEKHNHELLLRRLSRANVLRRQHFRYWHEQADKRKYVRQTGSRQVHDQKLAFATLGAVPIAPRHTKSISHPAGRSVVAPSNPTSVTRIDPQKVRPLGTSAYSRASQNKPVKGPAGDRPPWPSVENLPTTSYFECPYCSVMCPSSFRKDDTTWSLHVRHDLRPYCCTYLDCNSGDDLFDSRVEWSSHEKYAHRRVYRCADHPSEEFDEEQYTLHVRKCHSQYVDEMTSSYGLQGSKSTTTKIERDCPLCFSSMDSLEAMEIHLIYHLECIALLALPRATGLEKGSEQEDTGSADIVQDTDSRFSDSQLSDFVSAELGHSTEQLLSDFPILENEPSVSLTQQALTIHEQHSAKDTTLVHGWLQNEQYHENPEQDQSGAVSAVELKFQPSTSDSESDSDGHPADHFSEVDEQSGKLRPALRPSSRRRPSSQPGTPTYPKAVHFDSHLEHVRHFLQVDIPRAVSTGPSPVENYEIESEFPFGSDAASARSRSTTNKWEISVANFPPDSEARRSQNVFVERIFLSADNKNLIGIIAVQNLGFQKSVVVRFTLNYWKTVSEVVAEYTNDIRQEGDHDNLNRFTFCIKLTDVSNLENRTLFFCVRYNVNSQEFWDNNGSSNYQVDFAKKIQAPQSKKPALVQGASPRSRPLPPTSSGRPAAMPTSFDDLDLRVNTTQSSHWLRATTPPVAPMTSNPAALMSPDKTSIASQSYQELVEKYCFFGMEGKTQYQGSKEPPPVPPPPPPDPTGGASSPPE